MGKCMKYIIWGAGNRGKIINSILQDNEILAFIDSNKNKIGKTYCGKPIISYEEYKQKYRDIVIIVSPVMGDLIKAKLKKDFIFYQALDECPSEFMGYGWTRVKNKMPNFLSLFEKEQNILIYGCTLYSIWLYDRIKNKKDKNVYLIASANMGKKYYNILKRIYSEYPIIEYDEVKMSAEKVLISSYDGIVNESCWRENYIDAFRLEKYFDEYDNKEIKQFCNAHMGEECFIVATGPSLRIEDLEMIQKKYTTFSMNSIYGIYDQTDWRPDYYAIVDAIGIDMKKEELLKIECGHGFIADSSIEFDYSKMPSNMHLFHAISGKYFYDAIPFSEECSKYMYSIGTITYICMQLAIYMGFKNIYLIGVDFNYKPTGGNYVTSKDEVILNGDFIQTSNYYVKRAYEKALLVAQNKGVQIMNATRGGNLEVFKRVNLDELLNK